MSSKSRAIKKNPVHLKKHIACGVQKFWKKATSKGMNFSLSPVKHLFEDVFEQDGFWQDISTELGGKRRYQPERLQSVDDSFGFEFDSRCSADWIRVLF